MASDGKIDFFKQSLIQEIGRFIYREHIAGPYFINFADGDAKASCDRALIYHYGLRINDNKLMDLALSLPAFIPDELDGPPVSLHRWLCEQFDCRGYLDKKNTVNPPLIADTWLPDIQVAAAREQEGSINGLYLALKGGHNDESHNHNDVGNFIVYLNGFPALIDVGVGIYTQKTFSADRYQIWNMQSAFHNLPSINDFQQGNGRNFSAQNVQHHSNEQFMKVSMEISQAYPSDAGIKSFQRSFCFQRSGSSSISLEDRFEFTQEKNSLCQFLMCLQKPIQIVAGKLSIPVAVDAALLIAYDTRYSVFIEEIKIQDGRLEKAWGTCIYRVLFSADELPALSSFRIVISKR